eukprot:3665965-Amphidinium_carterae.1
MGHSANCRAVDVSQGIDRAPRVRSVPVGFATQRSLAPCVLPGTKLWILKQTASDNVKVQAEQVKEERLMTAYEALLLQSWPVKATKNLIQGASPNLVLDLAGNAFTGSAIQAVFMSLFCTLSWSKENPLALDNLEELQNLML